MPQDDPAATANKKKSVRRGSLQDAARETLRGVSLPANRARQVLGRLRKHGTRCQSALHTHCRTWTGRCMSIMTGDWKSRITGLENGLDCHESMTKYRSSPDTQVVIYQVTKVRYSRWRWLPYMELELELELGRV